MEMMTTYLVPVVGSILLLAIWPRNPWQWWAAMVLLALTVSLMLLHWVSNHFTGEGITLAVIAHLIYGWRDAELGIARFPLLVVGVLACLMILPLLCLWLWRRMRSRRGGGRVIRWIMWPACLVAVFSSAAAQDVLLLVQAAENVGKELNGELKWELSSTDRTGRPFVWIYLESMERAFLDQGRLPGVAPGLAELEQSHLSFRGIRTAPLMNWTVAGMVASQCGMPFEPTAKQKEGYQAGASCLGDLLVNHGYELSYIGGADAAFSGKGRFYREHGFSTVLGFEDLKGRSARHSIWGVFDDVVFAKAKDEFTRLKKSGGRFGLMVLTTATHPPEGFISPECEKQQNFDNPMLAAVHCSDGQVTELVSWLQKNGPEELLIIISSDHLQVAGSAQEILEGAERENTMIVIGDGEGVIDRPSTMVDVAPTVAGLLGFEAKSIGLGRNLMLDEPTLAEKLGYYAFISIVPGWRVHLRNGKPYQLCNKDPLMQPNGDQDSRHITASLCRTDY